MGQIRLKPGVDLGTNLSPAGARILEALKDIARPLSFDLVITSARDGVHSGPSDPHHSGEAFDIRTRDLSIDEKLHVLRELRAILYRPAARRFYAFLEDAGGPNEHIHVQRRAGTTYSMMDYLANL